MGPGMIVMGVWVFQRVDDLIPAGVAFVTLNREPVHEVFENGAFPFLSVVDLAERPYRQFWGCLRLVVPVPRLLKNFVDLKSPGSREYFLRQNVDSHVAHFFFRGDHHLLRRQEIVPGEHHVHPRASARGL